MEDRLAWSNPEDCTGAFWATPRMTVGHLLLAGLLTVYVLIGIQLEQRTLSKELGAPYRLYLRNVPAFLPRLRRRSD